MYCPAIEDGACGTNCAYMHMMEDDSKLNHHIADNYEKVYKDIIDIPYSETVFGEDDIEISYTPEELNTFLRSEKALKVYSNIQEHQALSNIFN